MDVTPILHNPGQAIAGRGLSMQPAKSKRFDIQTLNAKSNPPPQRLGGMTLSSQATCWKCGDKLRLMSLRNGGSVDVVFNNLSDQRLDRAKRCMGHAETQLCCYRNRNAGAATIKALVDFRMGIRRKLKIPSLGTELIRTPSEHQGSPKKDEEAPRAVTILQPMAGQSCFRWRGRDRRWKLHQ